MPTTNVYKPGVEATIGLVKNKYSELRKYQSPEEWEMLGQTHAALADLEQWLREQCGWDMNQRLKPGQLVLNPSLSHTDVYEVLPMHPSLQCNWLENITTGQHIVASTDDQYLIVGHVAQTPLLGKGGAGGGSQKGGGHD